MRFGHHLRADENVDFMVTQPFEHGFAPLTAGGIAIQPRQARVREDLTENLLELLGAEPELHQLRRPAQETVAAMRSAEIAVMTAQHARALVRGERNTARGTLEQLAAPVAAHARRKAAAVQEQDRLLVALQALLERPMQRLAQHALARWPHAMPREIDDLDRGQRLRGGTLAQTEPGQ